VKTKLLLWLALSAMVAALMLAIVAAAFRNGEAAIYLGAAAAFFAFMAAVLAGDLDRWREASRNDRDWRIHPRL
jgi:hypothetical protein